MYVNSLPLLLIPFGECLFADLLGPLLLFLYAFCSLRALRTLLEVLVFPPPCFVRFLAPQRPKKGSIEGPKKGSIARAI